MSADDERKRPRGDGRIADAPAVSGVYLMKDKAGRVLYVGKAKNLRSRVQSYFRESGDGRENVATLRDKVRTVEYVTTGNEQEALILEDKLIKEYQPKYNLELKDDRRYFSVKVTVNEEYPRLLVCHQRQDDGALYFGPFAAGAYVKRMVKRLQLKHRLRRCAGEKCQVNGPCMYAQIDACSAPCSGGVDQEQYMQRVQAAMAHLRRAEAMRVEEK
jgi:excinuclease ABC subunit C